jgi:DNA polymerase-3 subunit delta'
MNANAANSLLKSLEDPASGACFLLVSDNPRRLIPTIRSRCIGLALGVPDESASLAWLKKELVEDAASWLAFAGGAPLLAKEYAQSERGTRIKQVVGLLKLGSREALLAWPVADRDQMEILSEVLQKWAYDQAVKDLPGGQRFFGPASGKPVDADAWLRFAREAGRYRVAARHPLNPKLFAADLIGRMPS